MAATDPYDRLPYTDHAYAEAHPDRLAVVARLSGWSPPAVETARVLELGCGRGGNLLPLAAALPGATLVGVDRSALAIEEARRIAAEAGLGHATFVVAALEDHEPDGTFDYVLCHGVCSWVPPSTRRALLALVARALAPGGVAYVSFNVLPGWYERLAARDWLRAHPSEDAAASLAWLRDAVSPELGDYRRRLDAVARRIAEAGPAYAAHEFLATDHHPQPVTELLAEAGAAGLSYLGDAIPAETALELLPDAVLERARDLPPAGAQQLVDFVRCTAFRRTLLVREVDARARGWAWPGALAAGAMSALRVASRLRPHDTSRPGAASERFDGPGASVQLSDPAVRRALHELARLAPRSLPLPELARRTAPGAEAGLGVELLDLWLAGGALDLHAFEPALGDGRDPRPRACPLARGRAEAGGSLTNRWHQEVLLDDPLLRDLLALLDGARTLPELEAALAQSPGTSALPPDDRARLVRAGVDALAAAALLAG